MSDVDGKEKMAPKILLVDDDDAISLALTEDTPRAGSRRVRKLQVRTDERPEQLVHVGDDLVQIDDKQFRDLFPLAKPCRLTLIGELVGNVDRGVIVESAGGAWRVVDATLSARYSPNRSSRHGATPSECWSQGGHQPRFVDPNVDPRLAVQTAGRNRRSAALVSARGRMPDRPFVPS